MLTLLLAVSSYTPKIKWWQTEVAVSFNVLADCTTTPEVELEPPVADEEKPGDGERGVAGGFRFKCTDGNGAEATLAFELREPVIDAKCYAVLNPSRTKTKRVRCDLVKEEPHFFDRLTAGEKELKGVASVDYDRWVEPDDEAAPAAESVDYESAPGVTLLDAAALNAARKEHDLVVLDVFYPWCARARNSSARNSLRRAILRNFLTRRRHTRAGAPSASAAARPSSQPPPARRSTRRSSARSTCSRSRRSARSSAPSARTSARTSRGGATSPTTAR